MEGTVLLGEGPVIEDSAPGVTVVFAVVGISGTSSLPLGRLLAVPNATSAPGAARTCVLCPAALMPRLGSSTKARTVAALVPFRPDVICCHTVDGRGSRLTLGALPRGLARPASTPALGKPEPTLAAAAPESGLVAKNYGEAVR